MNFNRRSAVKMGTIGALAFTVDGVKCLLTPREAHAQEIPYSSLNAEQVATFDHLGDILLPGARDAGFTHFIDSQISNPAEDLLSLLRYMDWPPPYADFYIGGADALNELSNAKHGNRFSGLSMQDATSLIGDISANEPEVWSGPPSPLFYFVLRSDAVDVVYGVEEGFDQLNLPYAAHLEPKSKW